MDFAPKHSTLTKCLVERGLFAESPFTLIDVGCGGGISNCWRAFAGSLRALGIDPRISECRRLQANEANPQVTYTPAFVRLPTTDPFRVQRGNRSPWSGNPWERTSPARAMAILQERTAKENQASELNAWQEDDLADNTACKTLDQLVDMHGLHDVDAIKIDVDGLDLEVLHSAAATLRRCPVLGCVLEVNFFGTDDPTDHSFHNMDRFMRAQGFELFDLSTRRCSSVALPAPFRCDGAPHETLFGRIVQGDALYLRDPCGWKDSSFSPVTLTPIKLLKLACVFELFNLPDQAAELIRDYADEVKPLVEAKPLLDLLANELDPRTESYDLYLRGFLDDPTSFYPSRRPIR